MIDDSGRTGSSVLKRLFLRIGERLRGERDAGIGQGDGWRGVVAGG